MEIPVFGTEQHPLNKESGLSYTVSDIYSHVPIHTHNHYELFIISEGTAYHMINDSVQTVRKEICFLYAPMICTVIIFIIQRISVYGILDSAHRFFEMFRCFWSRKKRWISC